MRVARGLAALLVIGSVVTACAGPATASPAQPASPGSSGAVVVDPTLLDILPATVAGIDLFSDEETAAGVATTPGLADSVRSIAVALYAGIGPSAEEDLAIVNVVSLPDGVFDDAFFRSWRDSFDAAACEPAGGVAIGVAQADIAGRTVFIGSCQNGGHTYHVHLGDPERLVAVTAFGDDRLGEQIMAGLEE